MEAGLLVAEVRVLPDPKEDVEVGLEEDVLLKGKTDIASSVSDGHQCFYLILGVVSK